MMKKIFLFAVLGLAMTSCLDDDGEDVTNYVSYSTANLVIPANGEDPFVLPSVNYKCEFNYTQGNLVVSTENLQLNLQSVLSFKSDPVDYFYGNYAEGQVWKFNIDKISSILNGAYDTDYDINNLSCTLTTAYYAPQEMWTQTSLPFGTVAMLNYNIGNLYTVKTFPLKAYYSGTTTTHHPGEGGADVTFVNDAPLYGITIDAAKNKASVEFYNAKFAEAMPMSITFTLDNLDVKFTNRGYYITGENIVPVMAGTPMERYTFDNFRLSCVDENLTKVNIEYNVAGNKGEFAGSYIVQ